MKPLCHRLFRACVVVRADRGDAVPPNGSFRAWVMAVTLAAFLATSGVTVAASNVFVVAAYNVANWTRTERAGVAAQPKPVAEREAVVNVLARVRPDVLGLEEMGTTNDLAELAARLAERGLEYPHREWIAGADYERHVALLSRFPITERYSRTDYRYPLGTNSLLMSRGILEVTLRVNSQATVRAMVVHLKSRRAVDVADQAQMRGAEARLLRQHIDEVLRQDPDLKLVVMGDLNDTPGTGPIRTVLGADPFRLVDLRPVDSHGGRGTQFWGVRQQFSCIDYLLCSRALAKTCLAGSARIADFSGWFAGSDHRAVYASFALGEGTAPATARASAGPGRSRLQLALAVCLLLEVMATARAFCSCRR